MPSYNGGFPVGYTPMSYAAPSYYAAPQVMPQIPAPAPMQPQVQPTQMSPASAQALTPPTIRAEIVQVDGEDAAAAFPVGAGASQMMIARDESAIFIKSAMANGQTTLDVFVKRPPAPPAPVFDPGEYVRRDEIESLVAAAVAAQTAPKKGRKEPEE